MKLTWTSDIVTSLPAGYVTATQTIATAQWCYNNDITYINGGKLYTGTVTAEKISAASLSAISANLGTVTAGIIKSTNYVANSTGMQLNLANGVWDSKYFKIATDGSVTASNLKMTGGNISIAGTSYDTAVITLSYSSSYYSKLSPGGLQVYKDSMNSGNTAIGPGYMMLNPNAAEAAIMITQGAYSVDIAADSFSITGANSNTATVISYDRSRMNNGLSIGYENTTCKLSAASFICNDWVRTVGNTGWYSQSYGGGWYMTDTTWIRAYNSKSVYTPGTIMGGVVKSSAGTTLDSRLGFKSKGEVTGTTTFKVAVGDIIYVEANGSGGGRQILYVWDPNYFYIGTSSGGSVYPSSSYYYASISGGTLKLQKVSALSNLWYMHWHVGA